MFAQGTIVLLVLSSVLTLVPIRTTPHSFSDGVPKHFPRCLFYRGTVKITASDLLQFSIFLP